MALKATGLKIPVLSKLRFSTYLLALDRRQTHRLHRHPKQLAHTLQGPSSLIHRLSNQCEGQGRVTQPGPWSGVAGDGHMEVPEPGQLVPISPGGHTACGEPAWHFWKQRLQLLHQQRFAALSCACPYAAREMTTPACPGYFLKPSSREGIYPRAQ